MKHTHRRFFTASVLVFALLLNFVSSAAQDGDIVGGASGDIAGGSSVFVFRVSRRKSHDRSAFIRASFNRTAQARLDARKQRIAQSKLIAQTSPRSAPTTKPVTGKPEEMEKMRAAGFILTAAKGNLARNDLDEAEEGFDAVRNIDPSNAEAAIGLGKIYVARGDALFDQQKYQKATASYLKAVEFDNQNADAFAGLGDTFDALDQPKEAVAAYEKALAITPNLTALDAPLGVLYYEIRDYENSAKRLKLALDAKPDDTKLRDLYGLVLYRLDRNEDAVAALETAVKANPKNPTTYYYLGEVYDRLNRQPEAVAAYRRTLEIDPKFVEAYYDLGVAYYNRADYTEAAKNYEQAIALKGNYIEARLNLADSYRLLENYPKAVNQYQVIVLGFLPKMTDAEKARINEAEMYSKFGYCLNKNNESKRAIEFMQKAVDKQPDAVNYTNLAWAYNSDKNYQMAKQAASEAIKRNPNFAAAYYNLGNAQTRAGETAAAIESYKQALKIKKDWAEALNNLGAAYGAQNDWERAADAHRDAVRADPKSAEARYNLGFAELKTGDRKAAESERDALQTLDANLAQKLDALIKLALPEKEGKKKKKDKKNL